MANSSTIQLVIDAQDKASSTLRKVGNETKKLNNSYKDFSNKISGIGRSFSFEMNLIKKAAKIGAAAILGLGAASIYFGKKAVDAAGKAEDIDTLFGLAFDETEQEMRDFADEFSDEFGRATTSIKKMAGDMGFAISMGTEIGEDAMAKMTKESIEAAEGLAIAYDSVEDGEQAMRAITQAYNGSNDALMQLIPTIREQAIKQRAVEMGLASTEAQVTRTARAEALHQMIMEGSVKSRQMLAEAEGTYTDTMLRYEAAVQETSETIGGIFKPIVTETFQEINPLIEKFGAWVEENSPMIKEQMTQMANKIKEKIKEWYESVGGREGIEQALKDLWKTLTEKILPTIGKFIEITWKIIKVIVEHRETIWKLIKAYYAFRIAIAGAQMVSAIQTLTSGVIGATKALKGMLAILLAPAGLVATVVTLTAAIAYGLNKAMENWEGWLVPVRRGIMAMFGPLGTALELFTNWEKYIDSVSDALDRMIGWIKDAADWMSNLYEKAKKAIGKSEEAKESSGRQHGGAVSAGTPYIVGEHRPEVFVPSQSGNIRQMDQVGGGEVNVNFNNVSVRNDDDLQSIIDTVKKTLAREQELNSLGAR